MEILVCIKQVPDTASSIAVNESGTDIVREGINYVINPYDECAIEEALRIKDALKDVQVTLLSAAPADVTSTLRMGLAMGADRAVQVLDKDMAGSDSLCLAKILAGAARKTGFDLIFCGKQAVDDDCAQVGPMLARLLDIPVATFAVKFELSADRKSAVVHRELEEAIEALRVELPCLVTAQKGLNVPRLPSLSGIMQAKKKEILSIGLADVGLSASDAGEKGARIKRAGLFPPKERTPGRILEGEFAVVVSEVVKLLKEKEKVL